MSPWRLLCITQFLILLVIYTFLGLTGEPGNYVPMFNDKLMHCSGYIVGACSISFAFPYWKYSWRAIFLITYSIGIEIGQYLLPTRSCDFFDVCANSTGVLIGLSLIAFLSARQKWFRDLLYLHTNEPA